MGEVILINVGECGNRIGHKFWTDIATEHGINESGHYQVSGDEDSGDEGTGDEFIEGIGTYFTENKNGTYSARGLNVDLDPGVLNEIKVGNHGGIYVDKAFVSGHSGMILLTHLVRRMSLSRFGP